MPFLALATVKRGSIINNMTSKDYTCFNCGQEGSMDIFYKVNNVPAHSVLIFKSRNEAIEYPKGDVILAFCQNCGFISNIAFDVRLQEYSPRYEGTQAFSPTFNSFQKKIANRLIERFDLHEKKIIEVGCGQGEFLELLCLLGGNKGIGFDPSYRGREKRKQKDAQIIFIRDFYSEKYAHFRADLIVCKMTLEHIYQPNDFIRIIRRSIGDRKETVVFFQVPDIRRILDEVAFWDIYYEHCSYFSNGSLTYLFKSCGFDIIDIWRSFNNQYLMIEAKPGSWTPNYPHLKENNFTDLKQNVIYFTHNYHTKLQKLLGKLIKFKKNKKRIVVWGSGSKAVAFLTTLKINDEIEYAVDINPYKHGTFLAGTGHKILRPTALNQAKPDIVIVMNPIYIHEIRQQLQSINISTEIISISDL